MGETSRDRMAYWIWCVKYDMTDSMLTGDNFFLLPEQQLSNSDLEDKTFAYAVADKILEMLRSDILDLVVDGKDGLFRVYDGWGDGIRASLKVLGWERCGAFHTPSREYCEVEITPDKPHGPKHSCVSNVSPFLQAVWPVED